MSINFISINSPSNKIFFCQCKLQQPIFGALAVAADGPPLAPSGKVLKQSLLLKDSFEIPVTLDAIKIDMAGDCGVQNN